MQLVEGKKYVTKSGNVVLCQSVNTQTQKARCLYVDVKAEGHDNLKDATHTWDVDGGWETYRGGIHDITKEA